MADYIDRNVLLEKMFPYGCVDKATYSINAKAVERAIKDAPAYTIVDICDDDFGLILNCAVRYCLGRQTYMPSVVIGYIAPLLPRLTTRTLDVFKRDVESAGSYGDEKIDKPGWMKFLAAVTAELERRNCDERE